MSFVYILIFIVVTVVAGFFWGRYTIKQDTLRTNRDDAALDKLHKIRS
jgi:hypothetical protein